MVGSLREEAARRADHLQLNDIEENKSWKQFLPVLAQVFLTILFAGTQT